MVFGLSLALNAKSQSDFDPPSNFDENEAIFDEPPPTMDEPYGGTESPGMAEEPMGNASSEPPVRGYESNGYSGNSSKFGSSQGNRKSNIKFRLVKPGNPRYNHESIRVESER